MHDGDAGRHIQFLLAERAHATPNALAIVEPSGQEISTAELQERAASVSSRFDGEPGRVGVRLANDAASIAAVHGVWQAGGSVVALSHVLPDAEAERRLAETRARHVIERPGEQSVRPLLGGAGDHRAGEAVVIFTSGTTGRPKGAVLSFRAIAASLRTIAVGSGLPPEGRALVVPPRRPSPLFTPLAHMGGMLGSLSGWYLGKPLLPLPKFRVDEVFDLVGRFDLDVLRLTPAMVYDLAFYTGEAWLGRVRSVNVGTAPLPESTRKAFEARYGIPVLLNYGQTEFAGAIAFERYDDVRSGRRPPGSVGRIAPGVEVRIVDDAGHDVPRGEVGEILARSGSAMDGYLGSDGVSLNDRRDAGWLATGDLGGLDKDDILTVVGRVRDVIICGGFNVYPAMAEAALNRQPGVIDSAVAGLDDARLGEIPVAVVVVDAQDDADRVVAGALTGLRRELAPYEVPRRVVPVGAVPRTDNGKVDRAAIARLAAADDVANA